MFYKDQDGKWKFLKVPKHFNPIYAKALEKYFNCLDSLFKKAQEKSEFEFILSLLNITGQQGPGWEPFETTKDIFRFFNKLKKKIKYGKESLYLTLLLYGLTIEASYPYDLIMNLLTVASGERFTTKNFPDKKIGKNKTRPQFPSEKINKILDKAQTINLEHTVVPIVEIFNKELRNSIFHSDYTIYGEEIRIPQIYKRSDIIALINKSLAYFETILNLKEFYRLLYTEPKTINVHPEFCDPNAKATVMVREGTGVIGIRIDNAHIALLLPYEQKLLEEKPDLNMFPPNKIDRLNRYIRFIPIPIRRKVIRYYERILNIK